MAETYEADRELFRKLGLEPFDVPDDGSEHHVGRVYLGFAGDAHVDVFVKCHPAQAWRFECYSQDAGETVHLRGGTGKLSDYWSAVEALGRRRIVVESVEPELAGLEQAPELQPPGPRARPSSLAVEREQGL